MKSIYYKIIDGDSFGENEDEPIIAASVIKIPIMVEAFYQISLGRIHQDDLYTLQQSDKMPSCGALNRMHNGLVVTIRDLIELMIVLSDNTATNILIDLLGMDQINQRMVSLGFHKIKLNRKLFDHSIPGVENYITAREIGELLEMIYLHKLPYSYDMMDILSNQKLNSKIPFYLHPKGIHVAHKTGEDTNITHDVGIIFTRHPFILCMLCQDEDVCEFEREIQNKANQYAKENS